MALAKLAAMRSGCNSRPTGAVIVKNKRVIATGYNGSIQGQPQCTDKDSSYCLRRASKVDDTGENKYQECPSIHAEQNAINQVARCGGISLDGAIIYCTLEPCIFCLKNIVSVGIKHIVYENSYRSDDPTRDSYWQDQAVRYRVTVRCVDIEYEQRVLLAKNCLGITSQRRL